MTLRPCLACGEPTPDTRCAEHQPPRPPKPSARTRGYSAAWDRLSKQARKLQPFCLDCGSTEDLQADHTPQAWAAKAEGKRIKLSMIDVVCGDCNRARGAARGNAVTRGDTPPEAHQDPLGKARKAMKTTMVVNKGGCGAVGE